MTEPMRCTADDVDEKGVGRCPCSLVTATGGACRVFGPPPTFAEAFPYLADLAVPGAAGAQQENDQLQRQDAKVGVDQRGGVSLGITLEQPDGGVVGGQVGDGEGSLHALQVCGGPSNALHEEADRG